MIEFDFMAPEGAPSTNQSIIQFSNKNKLFMQYVYYFLYINFITTAGFAAIAATAVFTLRDKNKFSISLYNILKGINFNYRPIMKKSVKPLYAHMRRYSEVKLGKGHKSDVIIISEYFLYCLGLILFQVYQQFQKTLLRIDRNIFKEI